MTISSPAKVNLILRILDRRPDGYHNLWSLMQTVGLADDLRVSLDPSSKEILLDCTDPRVPLGPANLIHRAATEVLQRTGATVGVRIHLIKRIPMGAGLGGGSSNAAATVSALNRLLDLGWTSTQMAGVAQELGSDVPFFFFAPTGIVTGRGERVHPVRLLGGRALLLVNPGFGVETKWAYQALAAARTTAPVLPDDLHRLNRATAVKWEELTSLMANDFEEVVFRQHPVLAAMKSGLLRAGAESAFLSGTGATVFGIFPTSAAAVCAQRVVVNQAGWRSWVVPAEPAAAEASSGGA